MTYLKVLKDALEPCLNGAEFAVEVAEGALVDLKYNPEMLQKVDTKALADAATHAKALCDSLKKVLAGLEGEE